MALLDIVTFPDPVLREMCEPVAEVTDEIRTLLDNMAETMYDAPGIGLAAPQIAVPKRIIVVDVGPSPEDEAESTLYKLVNPEIVSKNGETDYDEGCLSLPGISERVSRAATVKVEALNEHGEHITIDADGLLAICLQHEIDHLNGVLILDHISRLKRSMAIAKLKKHNKSSS